MISSQGTSALGPKSSGFMPRRAQRTIYTTQMFCALLWDVGHAQNYFRIAFPAQEGTDRTLLVRVSPGPQCQALTRGSISAGIVFEQFDRTARVAQSSTLAHGCPPHWHHVRWQRWALHCTRAVNRHAVTRFTPLGSGRFPSSAERATELAQPADQDTVFLLGVAGWRRPAISTLW